MLLGVLGAIVAVDAVLFAYVAGPPGWFGTPPLDRISSVTWNANGTQLSSGSGFEAHAGVDVTLTLIDTNLGATLDFTAAETTPSSFSVIRASLPLIPSGSTGNLTVTVGLPTGSYSGPLSIDLT